MRKIIVILAALVTGCERAAPVESAKPQAAGANPALYAEDFEKLDDGAELDDALVLDGEFRVRMVDGNHVLELAGQPLGTFGVLMGPAVGGPVEASVRVRGESSGKRSPDVGLGVGEVTGYRLHVASGAGKLELRRGEEVLASEPFKWKSDEWVTLRLAVSRASDGWRVAGEAGGVRVTTTVGEEPPLGRVSVWGTPYAGKAIRFDDVRVDPGR